jgi:hypothetical protein
LPAEVKELYAKHPNLSTELYPIVMARKEILDQTSAQLNLRRNYSKLKPQENEFSIK